MAKKSLTLLMMLLLLWLCGYGGFLIHINYLEKKPQSPTKTDAIVVLTGGPDRVNTGLNLLARGQAKELFISGVGAQVQVKELLALWDSDQNNPPCCITLGRAARDTIGNATETRDWVHTTGMKSIRLITSSYHMPRSMLEFRHALPSVEILAHPVSSQKAYANREEFWILTFKEYNKTLIAWIKVHV